MSGHDIRPLASALGAVIRTLRSKVDVSQEQLAFFCGLDRTYVSRIERGLVNPSLRTLVVLAQALDTSPSTLLRRAEALLIDQPTDRIGTRLHR